MPSGRYRYPPALQSECVRPDLLRIIVRATGFRLDNPAAYTYDDVRLLGRSYNGRAGLYRNFAAFDPLWFMKPVAARFPHYIAYAEVGRAEDLVTIARKAGVSSQQYHDLVVVQELTHKSTFARYGEWLSPMEHEVVGEYATVLMGSAGVRLFIAHAAQQGSETYAPFEPLAEAAIRNALRAVGVTPPVGDAMDVLRAEYPQQGTFVAWIAASARRLGVPEAKLSRFVDSLNLEATAILRNAAAGILGRAEEARWRR